MCFNSSRPTTATSPRSSTTFFGPCGSQALKRLWIWLRWARFPPFQWWHWQCSSSAHEGSAGPVQEIAANELETLLNDPPGPEPGANLPQRMECLSRKQQRKVHVLYNMQFSMVYYIVFGCRLSFSKRWTARRLAFHCQLAYSARLWFKGGWWRLVCHHHPPSRQAVQATSRHCAQGAVVWCKAGRVPALCLQGVQGHKCCTLTAPSSSKASQST